MRSWQPRSRSQHSALATDAPNSEIAGTIAAAAELAARRGAILEAQELGARALQLTPPDAPNRGDILLALARFHSRAGDMASLAELLAAGMAELPRGRPRALAHLLASMTTDVGQAEAHLELAVSEAAGDPETRALALSQRAIVLALVQLERLDQAELWLREARSAASVAGAEVKDHVILADLWVRVLSGRPIQEWPGVWPAPSSDTDHFGGGALERPLAVRQAFRGELAQARATFERLLSRAEESGELHAILHMHVQRCELELRAGDARQAARLLDEFEHVPHGELGPERIRTVLARLHALNAAVVGEPEEAMQWAATVLAEEIGTPTASWDRLEAKRAMGIAALLNHDPDMAARNLRAVWEYTLREHVDDPGAFPVAADLVEALIQIGSEDEATRVTAELRRRSKDQHHPWGLVTASRCAAAIELVGGFQDRAAAALEEAADEYAKMGFGFERARTLLYLGRMQRRHKKRAAARASLEAAAAQFGLGGSPGWAEEAQRELARVSGRRTTAVDELTPSEQQVVMLAAGGMSNKEIAGELFVSVSNVESHLSHAYAKLGVKSRAQLASLRDDAILQ